MANFYSNIRLFGFCVLIILKSLTSFAQIQKILPTHGNTLSLFGITVGISKERIVITGGEISLEQPNFRYYSNFYKKNNKEYGLKQSIPEINQNDDWHSKTSIFLAPKINDNFFLQMNDIFDEEENFLKLNLFFNENETFKKTDSLIFKYKINNWEWDYLIDYNLNKNWIFSRKAFQKTNPSNPKSTNVIDYFYRIENNKIELIDSSFYRDFYLTNDNPGNCCSVKMNDEFIYVSDVLDDSKGQDNGSVLIYKYINDKWQVIQTLFQPDPANGKSFFGNGIFVCPNGRFLVVTSSKYMNSYNDAIYIFEFKGEKYELMQSFYLEWLINQPHIPISIDENQLFIGEINDGFISDGNGFRGSVYYYIFNGIEWVYKSKITPHVSDNFYGKFGWSLAHEKETLVVGALQDTTYGIRTFNYPDGQSYKACNGAAYVFQVPARDTLDISICEGDSYWFGEEALTMSGVYRDTLLASYGVDSVVVLNLSVLPPLESEVDTILCPGQELTVGDQTLDAAGFYTIPLKNIYGCDSIVSVSLSYAYLDMEADVSPDFGCQNGKISLLLQGNIPPYSYQWSNGAITSENLTDLSPGLYAVTVTDRSGCSFTLNDIEIKEEKVFELPNAFIPSSQMEENQRFRPYLFPGFEETVTITEMDVFNRFGEKVYSGTDTMGWDGTFRGEPSPPGSYLFRILLSTPCGEEMRTGSLLLVR